MMRKVSHMCISLPDCATLPVLHCLFFLGMTCCSLPLMLGTASLHMQSLYASMKSDKDCNSKVSAGKVLNYAGVSVLTPAEMSASARRVLRFIDLGGHEKYLKTALYGMTCMVTTFRNCPSILLDCKTAMPPPVFDCMPA